MEGATDGYNKRHQSPCCATVVALVGMIVSGFLILCLSSYKIGGAGMFGLLLAIAGTVLECWSAYSSFRNPRKAHKKRIVMFLALVFVGMMIYIAFVTTKKSWTDVVKTGVALSCAFMVGTVGVAIWAFRLPDPNDRAECSGPEAPPVTLDVQPPPVIENASNEDAEKVVEIHYISPFFGSEAMQWKKDVSDEKTDDQALNIAQNLPVGDPIEFPTSVYEEASGGDETLEVV